MKLLSLFINLLYNTEANKNQVKEVDALKEENFKEVKRIWWRGTKTIFFTLYSHSDVGE